MSASIETSAIFMQDQPNQIKNKINKYAFSGGQATEAEQRELGGDTEKDVAYQYLTFFLEDDEELEKIKLAYQKGEMLTGELKAKCIAELQTYVKKFQETRAQVTEAMVDDFMKVRPLEWKGNPNPRISEQAAVGEAAEGESAVPGGLTKNQLKKLAKDKMIAEKKAAKEAEKAAK